jgi:UDP-3-O-[3-hydroxymyristoyl] glucosamine N-acyltransferase
MSQMLSNILLENYDKFSIEDIISKSSLKKVCRTSFTWTNQPHTLCLAMNIKYFKQAVSNPNISAVITPLSPDHIKDYGNTAIIVSRKANELFYFVHNLALHNESTSIQKYKSAIHPTAQIDESSIIGENVTIGKNVVINSGCIIHNNTVIGDECVLYDNVTVGTQGFFSKVILGKKTHVSHFGGVLLGTNCIVHTGCNISRSVNVGEYTTLGDNVHIGIHSNIAHDCQIGSNTDISSKVVLSGRVNIGENCWIGASVTTSSAIKVGKGASIKIGSVVIEDVKEKEIVSGNFAFSHAKNLKRFLISKEK